MTTPEQRKLESLLGEQLRQDCAESERIGYSPKKFRIMMAESGPAGACVRVIMSAKIPDGFLKLLELNGLELTAEATVLRGPWKTLFEYKRPDLAI